MLFTIFILKSYNLEIDKQIIIIKIFYIFEICKNIKIIEI